MKSRITLLGMLVVVGMCCQSLAEDGVLRLSVNEYRDKMKAGWIGQIAGVSWAHRPNSSGGIRSFRPTRCPPGGRR